MPWVQHDLHPTRTSLWKGTKAELMTSIKQLNEKHKTTKFNFQISPRKIAFLDAMLYKDKNTIMQTILYRKPTDQQAFLHAKSEHPRSLNEQDPIKLSFKSNLLQDYRI